MSRSLPRPLCLATVLLLASLAFSQTTASTPQVIFSTSFGGSGFDEGFAVATDANGNVYVAGLTTSPVFPGTGSGLIGSEDAFVSKFSPTGQLLFTTRIGGSGFTDAFGIAVDQAGNVYITGQTSSTDFPIVNGFQTSYGGGFSDAFVAKLDASGNLIYSSFLGGFSPANEFGHAIAADNAGNVYIAGTTSALDFPVRNAFQSVYGGGFSDAFVAKINTNVSGPGSLIYATYLGSFGFDTGNAITIDGTGNAFVAGAADCCFPTTAGAVQTFIGNIYSHAYAAKFDPNGRLLYSTLIGGGNHDSGRGIAVDQKGVIYVVGEAESTDFPTTAQALQLQNHAAPPAPTAFITLIDPSVSGAAGLKYSSYLGGSVFDSAAAVAVDGFGRIYITGRTSSADFPVKAAFQPALGGGADAFVVQLDPSLAGTAGLTFGSFLGGFQDDEGLGIALGPGGRVAIAGFTDTPFPFANGFNSTREAFVTYLLFNAADTTPPSLIVPVDAVLNATSPAGATFNFNATATDLVDPNPTVQCTPPSGSIFPIGTTQVVCVATDASGNSTSGTFQVKVKGAQEQIVDLKIYVSSLNLDPGLTNSLEVKLSAAQQDPLPGACSDLSDFINLVTAKTGNTISNAVATQLITAASRIKAVMGCK